MTTKPEPERTARKFYKTADVKPAAGAFIVTLDGRALRTPAKAPFTTPTSALAEACAAEWNAQIDFIRTPTMPLTRLVNVALDFTPMRRAEVAASVAKYAQTDLISHRADHPASLIARQRAIWDPLLVWADDTIRARLETGAGVLAHAQPPAALEAFEQAAAALDDFRLTGLAHAVGLAGSAVIGLALTHNAIDAEAAFAASALDELYQLETWGDDAEARARLASLHAEFQALQTYFAALK